MAVWLGVGAQGFVVVVVVVVVLLGRIEPKLTVAVSW